MDLDPYLTALRDDLARATALADEPTRQVAERLAATLEPALRLALVQALSDASAEVTAALEDTVVEVRMAGRDPRIVVSRPVQAHEPDPEPEQPDEGTARITLRLPEAVKTRADAAAQQAGVSLNSWITTACRTALAPTTRSSRRISGWA